MGTPKRYSFRTVIDGNKRIAYIDIYYPEILLCIAFSSVSLVSSHAYAETFFGSCFFFSGYISRVYSSSFVNPSLSKPRRQ